MGGAAGPADLLWIDVNLRRVVLKGRDRILATVRDISDRKRAEEDLKLTRFSVEHASVSVFLIGPDARILDVNEQTCRSLGYAREELLAMTAHDIDPHFPAARWPAHWEALRKEHTLRFETEHRRKNGTLVPIDLSANYVSFGGREYNWAFASDMTASKQAERVLRDSEERYRAIVETSADWIWEMDLKGILTFNNPALEQILGYSPAELTGKDNFEYIDEEDRKKAEAILEKAIRERAGWKQDLLRWKHKDGGLRFLESNSVPVFDQAGALVGFRGSDRDVTEIKQAQEQLERAYGELEIKVEERTRELARTNDELRMEVTERKHAVDLIRKSKELSDALNALDSVIHSTLNVDEIMRRVVKQAAEALNVDASMVGSFEGDIFRVRYIHNMPESFTGRTLTANELRAIHHVALAGEATAFNDAYNDERLNIPFVREVGIRSLLVAPLFTKKKITGALTFYGLSHRFIFQEEHLSFASKLSASISLALENAQLYQVLSESERISSFRLAQIQNIYATAPIGLCFTDTAHRYVNINRTLADINGVSPEETTGRTFREVIPALAEKIEALCNQVIRTGEPIANIEIRGHTRAKPEGERFFLGTYYPIRDEKGMILGVNMVVQDITDRKQTEEALRMSEQRLRALLNSIPDMAWLKDRQGRFILVNDPFGRSAGTSAEELIGKTDYDAWPAGLAERYRTDDEDVMKHCRTKRVEEPLAVKDGPERWIESIKTCILNEQGDVVGTAGIARDITERRRMEEEIRHMAQHDALTGLPNRRMFIDILNLEMAQARRHQTKLAVLFLDLDRFKEVNDTLGHEAGDLLLKMVAARLRGAIRESDTVARIGGDEFNLVLSDIARVEDVSEIVRKVVDSVARPVAIAGHDLHVTTSVGISVYPDDAPAVDTLLRYADIAMYHAKESGRNTFRFYNPSINVLSLQRMKLAGFLSQAVKRRRADGGVPAPDRHPVAVHLPCRSPGPVEPSRRGACCGRTSSSPLPRKRGSSSRSTNWVLRTVCRQARTWRDEGFDSFCLSVNLSARQFQSPDLVSLDLVGGGGERPAARLPGARGDRERGHEQRGADRGTSCRNCGAWAFPSPSTTSGPATRRSAISKNCPSTGSRSTNPSSVTSRRTPTTGPSSAPSPRWRARWASGPLPKGVETEDQLSFLRESECDEAQGFLFSRPVAADQFREFIEAGR